MSVNNATDNLYDGLFVIGDPHLEGRQPGFRRDDYPRVILRKLKWCLDYSEENRLLPTILGDFFDKPRDNPTWMIGQLIELFSRRPAIGIYGNHDCAETELNDNDSLSILVKAGCIRLVSELSPWRGLIRDRQVFVGGSSYRHPIPEEFSLARRRRKNLFDHEPFVVWLTHHDISITGYDSGRLDPHEIRNVNLLINGHIHRELEDVQAGRTLWITPGNITRRSRSDACREHVPSGIQIDIYPDHFQRSRVVIPHEPFEQVFHETVVTDQLQISESGFVAGLAELNARRTESGAGLHQFLAANLDQFEQEVADQILVLADLVTKKMDA
ncbi:MAG: metallophosphoesterase [Planctomycetota bacterium]